MSSESTTISRFLAANLRFLRDQRQLTQDQLSKLCKVPRTTIATLESKSGNPTLSVLTAIAGALQVSIEELISRPRAKTRLYKKGKLPIRKKREGITVQRLLPDPIAGSEIERLVLEPGKSLTGIPHKSGTREYLFCEKGRLILRTSGEAFELESGDVAAFQGDQPHSYTSTGRMTCIAFSVVILAHNFFG